jgi:hypothetical protein
MMAMQGIEGYAPWCQVESGMVESVHEMCGQGISSYPTVPRAAWVLQWPGQVVLVVTHIFWTQVCSGFRVKGLGFRV